MNTSSDAAESVVRMSLQGMEVALKISGVGVKNVAAILLAFAKGQQKVKGKTKISNLLKSGKELKVFAIPQKDLKKFTEEAKLYGVLFSAIIDKKNPDPNGFVDIMVPIDDASKVNRIISKLEIATVDTATIRTEVEKDLNSKEGQESVNPNPAKAEADHLSEHTLKNKKDLDENSKKRSVKKDLEDIVKEQSESKSVKEKTNNTRNKKQKTSNQKKSKEKVIKL